MQENGQNGDIWTFSVCSFTSIIIIVTLKLMVYSRFYTFFNIFSIVILSVGVYFLCIWVTNYMIFSNTYLSMEFLWGSPVFYLTVFLLAFGCYVFDYFLSSYTFNIETSPPDFLRIHRKSKGNAPNFKAEFEKISSDLKTYYLNRDIEREAVLESRRELLAKLAMH